MWLSTIIYDDNIWLFWKLIVIFPISVMSCLRLELVTRLAEKNNSDFNPFFRADKPPLLFSNKDFWKNNVYCIYNDHKIDENTWNLCSILGDIEILLLGAIKMSFLYSQRQSKQHRVVQIFSVTSFVLFDIATDFVHLRDKKEIIWEVILGASEWNLKFRFTKFNTFVY